MIPPFMIYISFRPKGFGFWFPLFIFWPVILFFSLLLLPFWIMASIVFICIPELHSLLKLPIRLHELICSFHGLIIQVQDNENNISIKVI